MDTTFDVIHPRIGISGLARHPRRTRIVRLAWASFVCVVVVLATTVAVALSISLANPSLAPADVVPLPGPTPQLIEA